MMRSTILLMTLAVALGGRRGGFLTTSGSFTLSSGGNRAGNSEELGEADTLDDAPALQNAKANHWDLSNGGQCDEVEEAWALTDAKDHSMGKCVKYEADKSCSPQCYHQGKLVDETEDQAVCTKICRVPGSNGAQCNVVKMVMPQFDEEQGKTMYLTKSKVMQAGLHKENLESADPMACAGITTNRRSN